MDASTTTQRPVANKILNMILPDKIDKHKEDPNLGFSLDQEEGEIIGHKR